MSRGGLYNVELDAKTDVFKFATGYVSQRLFERQPIDDRVWIVATALTLIGFVTYQLLINSWFDTSKFVTGSAKMAVDDALKFLTMFMVVQLISGKSLSDPQWITDTGLFIASIVAYDVTLGNFVNTKLQSLDSTVSLAINDVLKWGSVFAANNFAKGGSFDKQWLMSTGGFLTGFVVYDVLIDKYTQKFVKAGSL
ncbi:hypothetical protein BMW23_0233 [Bodo saltans virus]|uniref:Uncharacterized protein n=1 Tax=Bodo saltans virus TaxID=2024608 RepID=A0A2H4UTM9_9VIRU|nr:hypothetical protein QJ851_gp0228 [Bodo saltans virus]ATZ80291.1 hypothetical protein BMW23_0233 [Bodo saltans virus]